MVGGHLWPDLAVRQDRPLKQKGTREVRSRRKFLFPRFVEAHHKSFQLLRSELYVYRRQWTHWETTTVPRPRCCAMFSRRHNQFVESEEQVVQNRRRTSQVGAGVEGWRTAIGGAEWRLPSSVHTGRPGDEISKMQKLLTEFNQIAAERHALSQELRRSSPKARSWGGDGPPHLNNVPPLVDDRQAIEEWMNELRSVGSADVISQVSNMLAQGASKMATLSRVSAFVLQEQSMDVQTSLGTRMCVVIANAKRRCFDGRAFSPSTLKTRCLRCEA